MNQYGENLFLNFFRRLALNYYYNFAFKHTWSEKHLTYVGFNQMFSLRSLPAKFTNVYNDL